MDKSQDRRSKNFTANDKDNLLNIILQYKCVIENKCTDATTTKSKKDCWEVITEQYNTVNESGVRTDKQLKELYAFLKRKARKNLYNDKAEQIKTGGGSYIPKSDEIDARIIGELKAQYIPDRNPFDSSANLFTEVVEPEVIISFEDSAKMESVSASNTITEDTPIIIRTPTETTNVPTTSLTSTPLRKKAHRQRYLKEVANSIINIKAKKTVNEDGLIIKKHKLVDKENEVKEQELQLLIKKNILLDLEIKIKTFECKRKEIEFSQFNPNK